MTTGQVELLKLGITPIDDKLCLAVESGLEWVLKNTSLTFDITNDDDLAALPANVRLFAAKYAEIMRLRFGISSESISNEANVTRTLYQMQTESGGNPYAINLWDSNAKKGIPSKGLMQIIDPTFKAYARPGYNSNIYDPLSNILAAVRYAGARYGSLAAAFRGTGYADGGIAYKPSVFGEDGAEMAIPLTIDKRDRALELWTKTGAMLGPIYPVILPKTHP